MRRSRSSRQKQGANATATSHYDHAIEAYRMAQHPIYYDDHPVKIRLCNKLNEMVDRRSEVADYPIERVEVPFDDGKTISCLLHLLPDCRKAPVVIYVPGMDQTKEVFPKAAHNIAKARGCHVLAMDGPGQGNSNMQKIRSVKDNYERARGSGDLRIWPSARKWMRRGSRSTASAWAATGRCGLRAMTGALPLW